MSEPCSDARMGALLAAYELNALSEDEAERFELHLLDCAHCAAELQRTAERAGALRSDAEVTAQIARLAAHEGEPRRAPVRVWRQLWPDTPLVFRPAFALVLVLLLAYPAYRGFRSIPGEPIGPVQVVALFQSRSAAIDTYAVRSGERLVLTFACPECRPRPPTGFWPKRNGPPTSG